MHALEGEQPSCPAIGENSGAYQQLGAAVSKLAAAIEHAVVSAAAAAP